MPKYENVGMDHFGDTSKAPMPNLYDRMMFSLLHIEVPAIRGKKNQSSFSVR